MSLREHERARFSSRSEVLATLHRNAERVQQERGIHLALVGQRRIGKTMIIQRFADDLYERHSPLVPVYFNQCGSQPLCALRLCHPPAGIHHLADFDLIGWNGHRYYISDPFVALWIKFTILERAGIRRIQGRHPVTPGPSGGTDCLGEKTEKASNAAQDHASERLWRLEPGCPAFPFDQVPSQ